MVLKAGDMERCLAGPRLALRESREWGKAIQITMLLNFQLVNSSRLFSLGAGETNCLQVTLGGTNECAESRF